jgi:plasmid stability protein
MKPPIQQTICEGGASTAFLRFAFQISNCYHDSNQVLEAGMAQILVRNLEDSLKTRLQRRAKRHGHSMEAEARDILSNALHEDKAEPVGFGTATVALFSGSGIYLDEPIAEIRNMRMEIPDFES